MSEQSLAQLRAQVIERARREPAATRRERAGLQRLVLLAAVGISVGLFVIGGGIRPSPRPERLVLENAVGAALLACGAAYIAFGRGRSMLGRPRAWLLAVVLGAPTLLLGWRLAVSSQYPWLLAAWAGRPGFRCLGLSTLLALAPLLGALWLRRGSVPVHPRTTAAAFGASAGALAWVLVDMWCPVAYVPHLLLGHVLPLLLMASLGALVGERVLAPQVTSMPSR